MLQYKLMSEVSNIFPKLISNNWTCHFLDALEKFWRAAANFNMTVHLQETTWFPMNMFSWNFILGTIINSCTNILDWYYKQTNKHKTKNNKNQTPSMKS